MEDHNLIFVVAENEEKARGLAKQKWKVGDIHIDWTQKLDVVDWYKISLEKTNKKDDVFEINSEYSE